MKKAELGTHKTSPKMQFPLVLFYYFPKKRTAVLSLVIWWWNYYSSTENWNGERKYELWIEAKRQMRTCYNSLLITCKKKEIISISRIHVDTFLIVNWFDRLISLNFAHGKMKIFKILSLFLLILLSTLNLSHNFNGAQNFKRITQFLFHLESQSFSLVASFPNSVQLSKKSREEGKMFYSISKHYDKRKSH